MKRAICSKCKSLIMIDESAPRQNCPNCHEEILTDAAIKYYLQSSSAFKHRADRYLFDKGDYQEAYKYYSMLLKLNETNLDALIGVVIAKLYCSNLHKIYIKEATDLLLKGSDQVEISYENVNNLSVFLNKLRLEARKIVDAIKVYKEESKYALKLYHNALEEYCYFIKAYLDIYKALDQLNQYLKDGLDVLNDELKLAEQELKEKVSPKNQNDTRHDFYDNKKHIVNDIFPNHKIYYMIHMGLFGVTGFGLVMSLVGLILMLTKVDPIPTYTVLGIGLVFFIGGYFVNHYIATNKKNKKN